MSVDDEQSVHGQQPEEDPLQKRVNELVEKQMMRYSKTLIEKLDDFDKRQEQKLDAKLETSLKGVVDYLSAQSDARSQKIVDSTIAALRQEAEKQHANQPEPRPAQAQQQADGTKESAAPQIVATKPLDYFLMSMVNFVSQITPHDVIEFIGKIKGGPAVNTMAADQMIQAFKISKLFTNIKVAETDIGAFEKMAHEALDTAKPTA